jgi:ABC-2 type transport system permease protein
VLRGLWQLTWLEIKIFTREPLGLLTTVGVPVLIFIVGGRLMTLRIRRGTPGLPSPLAADLPVLAAILITVSAVLSLVAIMAIYREGGILKRLRATPLRPHTILTAHVLVKLLLTATTMGITILAGRRFYPVGASVPLASFMLAVLFSNAAVLSLGFLIASVVPTARLAQPIGALIMYPMFFLSGMFAPIAVFPPLVQDVARLLPLTYVVSLLRGIWRGDSWTRHSGDMATLAVMWLVFTVVSAKVFRWE